MAKLRTRNSILAFTLIETLITLGICCGILLIGSLQLQRYQKRLIFDNTVREVSTTIEQASRFSVITGESILVKFSPQEHHLKISGGHCDKLVRIDKHIHISNLDRFAFYSTGSSSPRTVEISGYGFTKKMKYQMQWGRVAEQ